MSLEVSIPSLGILIYPKLKEYEWSKVGHEIQMENGSENLRSP